MSLKYYFYRLPFLLLASFCFFHCFAVTAPIKKIQKEVSKELSSDDLQLLSKGELVLKSESVEGEVWPRFKFYKLMKATPLDSICVFADFINQKQYVPNLVEASIVGAEKFNSILVSYKMHTPWPAPDVHYTTRNMLWNDGEGSFALEWNLVESNLCQKTDGQARFIPHNGHTLFIYENHITPKQSGLAKFFKGKAQDDALSTVKAIITEIEKTTSQKQNAAVLSRQLQLTSPILLEGKSVYKSLPQ